MQNDHPNSRLIRLQDLLVLAGAWIFPALDRNPERTKQERRQAQSRSLLKVNCVDTKKDCSITFQGDK
jgi:hypothetical protein